MQSGVRCRHSRRGVTLLVRERNLRTCRAAAAQRRRRRHVGAADWLWLRLARQRLRVVLQRGLRTLRIMNIASASGRFDENAGCEDSAIPDPHASMFSRVLKI